MMTIFAGIAEFERDLIRERTGTGPEEAKPRCTIWTAAKACFALDELARRLVSQGKSVREIAAVFNVPWATIYRLAALLAAFCSIVRTQFYFSQKNR